MKGKMVFPMRESWDSLIILDACRYDYFERVFRDYIDGRLTKRISPGTWTVEYCKKCFTTRYEDVVYISGNPYIRSNRVRISKKIRKLLSPDEQFNAEEHFYRVIDVWNSGWNDDLGTVLPEAVNRATLDALNRYPGKRLIVHYLQPHYPYLTLRGVKFKRRVMERMAGFIRWRLVDLFGKEKGLRFGVRLKLPPPPSSEQLVARRIGLDGIKKAYEDNLRAVMKNVAILINHLQGKIIITSDHGELLGEEGQYGHDVRYRTRPLVEVPWLEVLRPRRVISQLPAREQLPPLSEEDEEHLKKRLKALGYI
jgi:hypothetical protein